MGQCIAAMKEKEISICDDNDNNNYICVNVQIHEGKAQEIVENNILS